MSLCYISYAHDVIYKYIYLSVEHFADMRRDSCKYSCWVCVDPGKDRALGVDEKTM